MEIQWCILRQYIFMIMYYPTTYFLLLRNFFLRCQKRFLALTFHSCYKKWRIAYICSACSAVPHNEIQTPLTKCYFFCHEYFFDKRNTLYRSCDPDTTQKVQENIIPIALDTFTGYYSQPLPAKRIHIQITSCKSAILSIEYSRIGVVLATYSNNHLWWFVHNC